MKKVFRIVAGVMVSSFLYSLRAQTIEKDSLWTLEACIQYALDHNLQVKKDDLDGLFQRSQFETGISIRISEFERVGIPVLFL